ncbi:MAG: response regulator [Planctomycetota bacterium]
MNAESTFDRYTVLYVDDFEPERMLLTHRLRESSIGLTAVASVDEAIDALNRRSFDVVVSDLHLDRGRSGEDLLRIVKSGGLHAGPVVIVTGESDVSRLAPLIELGASAVLNKPVDAAALPEIVAALVAGRQIESVGVCDAAHLLRSLPGCMEELVRAAERRDSETALRVCRDLASTASGYGLTAVSRQAEQAVGLIGSGMTTPAARDALDRVISAVRGMIEAA